ncbi:MAG: DUF424 domain-containing protein [Candidatus Baldrarchaeia archaeon]
MRVYLKIWNLGNQIMVAVCDENLLGKKFRDGDLKLEVKEDFYGGELVPIEEGVKAVKKAMIANIVGENIVRELIKENLIVEEAVIRIAGIPHVQIVRIDLMDTRG